MLKIDYRAENKYIVSDKDILILKSRLKSVMKQDIHQEGEFYEVRSVYFDDFRNTSMLDNDSGTDNRSKYRIRTYYPGLSEIRLEIKEKERGFNRKTSCKLTLEEYEKIVKGEIEIPFGDRKPLNRLLLNMKCSKMEPKVIISYERCAFVHPSGNVRVTFDRNISASKYIGSFFDEKVASRIPVLPKGMHILEVKYDEMLPDIIAKQLEIKKLNQTAFSKYYLGRIALGDDHVRLP